MDRPEHAWVVRSGDENELVDLVEQVGAVAIGWMPERDLSDLQSRDDFKRAYSEHFPDQKGSRLNVNAGQIFRFVRKIERGNYLLTYDKSSRELIIGLVDSSYEYDPGMFDLDYNHVRHVIWLERIPRDSFTPAAKNSLGSALTVFRVDDHLEEIHRLTTGAGDVEPDTDEDVLPFYEEVKAKSDELISDLISDLDGYEFQDLVAGLLRAMGFRAVSSDPGPDRGIDIVAHPDALGFERPRIKAQVKHRTGSAGGPEMRQFVGTLRSGDNGLYVSTGGFTREAHREAESSREPVTLLDRDAFIRLFLEHYELVDPEFKAQIPLRKVWLPSE